MRAPGFFFLVMITIIIAGCTNQPSTDPHEKVELHVLSAASLSDAMLVIEQQFEEDYPEIDLILNFASSGTLQRQIEQGAPADVFLSASEEKFNTLKKAGHIHQDYATSLFKNELVVITKKSDETASLPELSNLKNDAIDRISIGVPESVPAGHYARETLENSNLWQGIQEKIVYAKDVRQVLSYVETGNVEVGFVYATDAKSSSKIHLLQKVDSILHTDIIYPGGIVKDTKHLEEAKTLFNFLQTEQSIKTFQKFGFMPID
ncbi:molybdate ABC transporter substrate-binding protein [Pseudalkalibacillus sp. Hm43]|uniref:molybdate ABC transporter substrate-binding protein n=1 Tax=Pseudalkalibacillus sp. Hm43 TaxID=3450742 RepID=UPI003F431A22